MSFSREIIVIALIAGLAPRRRNGLFVTFVLFTHYPPMLVDYFH